ncbi:MBL fold metallo-hydrolase [Flammeovirga pectinis]|uniref:MBL fold metallo-hydrolase n=1 Tax=Flammeovirga pectinis TaxID=2494373 RepID=A0A3Q9FP98_9BACT|nr:MBL fold metallo-hydrolase [Flammeovirga pectinis]AZQ64710.1 MBL fold metallo-hydrolase [Flammeovirga pectinis]
MKKRISKFILIALLIFAFPSISSAQTWEENLKKGATTTEKNYMNNPFERPENWKTIYTTPDIWPISENRGPIDRSPKDKTTKVLVLGTGTPTPNPYRYGPAMAVIIDGYPYFIDCGEGWWRALAHSVLTQNSLDLSSIFALKNLKYMFLTHLHEDHTVGLPSFINNSYKFGSGADKKVFGPEGVDEMMAHINAAWSIDRHEVAQGSLAYKPEGSTATGVPVWPETSSEGRQIFEDERVIVEAFPTKHGYLEHTYAYRFTAKSDGRIIVFGGDGTYSKGLVEAAKGADILFVEGITRKNVKYASWGGETEKEKVEVIGTYHMFPARLKRVYDESGVKNIVLVHVQNFNNPENFKRLGVLQEMIDEGIKNILLAEDGDLY